METILILFSLVGILFCGVPVAFAIGGLGFALLVLGDFSPLIAPTGLLSAVDNFILLAVPLFLLMSNVMLRGGVGQDVFAAAQAWVGHWPGGLAVATVLSCGVFAAISGSSVATAATVGTVAIPEMTRRGYPRPFVFGLVAAGGTLGILIPPSLMLIVYGFITEESVVELFLAGVGPGLLLMGLFVLYSIWFALRSPNYKGMERQSWAVRRSTTLRAFPTILVAAVVIVGIYLGWYTPTEAAAIGLLGALFVTTVVLRTLRWRAFFEAIQDSMKTTVGILIIVAGAEVFGKAITLYRIPQDISAFVVQALTDPSYFILVIALVLLLMGLFLEALSMMLIMVPVLIGAVVALAIDPIWFGIFFVIMVECALITPPVGLNLFVIQAVGKAQMQEVTRGVLPFLCLMLLSVAILYLFEDIVLWLPFAF